MVFVLIQRHSHLCIWNNSHHSQWKHGNHEAMWSSCVVSFFDYQGIIYHKYAHHRQTVNKENYLTTLCCLQDAVSPTMQETTTSDLKNHHNTASAHELQFIGSIYSKSKSIIVFGLFFYLGMTYQGHFIYFILSSSCGEP